MLICIKIPFLTCWSFCFLYWKRTCGVSQFWFEMHLYITFESGCINTALQRTSFPVVRPHCKHGAENSHTNWKHGLLTRTGAPSTTSWQSAISKQTCAILFCWQAYFLFKKGAVSKWKHRAGTGWFEQYLNEFLPYYTLQIFHFGSFYFSTSKNSTISQLNNIDTSYEI